MKKLINPSNRPKDGVSVGFCWAVCMVVEVLDITSCVVGAFSCEAILSWVVVVLIGKGKDVVVVGFGFSLTSQNNK